MRTRAWLVLTVLLALAGCGDPPPGTPNAATTPSTPTDSRPAAATPEGRSLLHNLDRERADAKRREQQFESLLQSK